jgi:anaerobic selenocysteine-containing dehydrogenase
MKPMNEEFSYRMPKTGGMPNSYGMPEDRDILFGSGSLSIPVFAINRVDGERIGLKTGDIITLETPLKKSIRGKALLTEEIMPGVIKTAFGPGGQRASGTGIMSDTSDYTPNINELFDPENISPLTGAPGFGDIMVKVIK